MQTFTWTAAGAAAAVEERNRLLLESEAAPSQPDKAEAKADGVGACCDLLGTSLLNAFLLSCPTKHLCIGDAALASSKQVLCAVCVLQGLACMVDHLRDEVAAGLAKITGAPDLAAAAEQLRREPMFCVETGG